MEQPALPRGGGDATNDGALRRAAAGAARSRARCSTRPAASVSQSSRRSAGSVSHSGAPPAITAAPATTTSSDPCVSTAAAAARCSGVDVADVGHDRHAPVDGSRATTASRSAFDASAYDVPAGLRRAGVERVHDEAAVEQPAHDGRADAAGGARDQRDRVDRSRRRSLRAQGLAGAASRPFAVTSRAVSSATRVATSRSNSSRPRSALLVVGSPRTPFGETPRTPVVAQPGHQLGDRLGRARPPSGRPGPTQGARKRSSDVSVSPACASASGSAVEVHATARPS